MLLADADNVVMVLSVELAPHVTNRAANAFVMRFSLVIQTYSACLVSITVIFLIFFLFNSLAIYK